MEERLIPMRKPAGWTPTVQRWSVSFPPQIQHFRVGYYAVQGDDDEALERSSFQGWLAQALNDVAAPDTYELTRFVDVAGKVNHLLIAYWIHPTQFDTWQQAPWNQSWWASDQRLLEDTGCWREELLIAPDRQETIYFQDFVSGVARCASTRLDKTQESGYWGAMRDRIRAAGNDPLESPQAQLKAIPDRITRGARWRISPPENLTIIRSGQYWAGCGEQQLDEYNTRLRPRLEDGLSYLIAQPVESGCCSLRYVRHRNREGRLLDESSVVGTFLSLHALERWAESHTTHKAIYAEAFRQLRTYQERRELRTWHEVFVLLPEGQRFEYLNCHPQTGILSYFDASREG